MNKTFSEKYVAETVALLNEIDAEQIEAVARGLSMVRDQRGRLFIVGVGDLASFANSAVDDFRRQCNIETYTPAGSLFEPTGRLDDDTSLANWLIGSRLRAEDGVLLFSITGGDVVRDPSANLVRAIVLCRNVGASVFGIVGRDGGYTADAADACVVVPPMFLERVAPHTKAMCAVIWQLLVSHPVLQHKGGHWEQMAGRKRITRASRSASVATPASTPT